MPDSTPSVPPEAAPLVSDEVIALTDAAFSQAMTLAMQNAVSAQQRTASILEAVSMQGAATLYSIDTAEISKASSPSAANPTQSPS